jgi:hypothetical protein
MGGQVTSSFGRSDGGHRAEYHIIQYLGMKLDNRWHPSWEIFAMSRWCLEKESQERVFMVHYQVLGEGNVVEPRRVWHSI